jgi:hypothetical protein
MKFQISVIDDLANSGTPAEMVEIDKFNGSLLGVYKSRNQPQLLIIAVAQT